MRKRILILGRNQMLIDGFFYNTSATLECQTCSSRTEDLASHIRSYQPELVAICMQADENKETLVRVAEVCTMMNKRNIPVALIGETVECDKLTLEMGVRADLVFHRAQHFADIAKGICILLSKRPAEENNAAPEVVEPKPEEVKKKERYHITVVDDDARMLKVLKEYLHEEYDVATAINGKIALKFLESKHTDLILLDYVMPDMDGPEVYEKIRAMENGDSIPIVFLTGMSEKDKIRKVMELKPQGYLLKPVERDRLTSTIKTILGT